MTAAQGETTMIDSSDDENQAALWAVKIEQGELEPAEAAQLLGWLEKLGRRRRFLAQMLKVQRFLRSAASRSFFSGAWRPGPELTLARQWLLP